jgi:hypothetical protein
MSVHLQADKCPPIEEKKENKCPLISPCKYENFYSFSILFISGNPIRLFPCFGKKELRVKEKVFFTLLRVQRKICPIELQVTVSSRSKVESPKQGFPSEPNTGHLELCMASLSISKAPLSECKDKSAKIIGLS